VTRDERPETSDQKPGTSLSILDFRFRILDLKGIEYPTAIKTHSCPFFSVVTPSPMHHAPCVLPHALIAAPKSRLQLDEGGCAMPYHALIPQIFSYELSAMSYELNQPALQFWISDFGF
jgi:hypothetical protein